MSYKRPYNETMPSTDENVKQAQKWSDEKAKALGLPTVAEKEAASKKAGQDADKKRAADTKQAEKESTVKQEDEPAAE